MKPHEPETARSAAPLRLLALLLVLPFLTSCATRPADVPPLPILDMHMHARTAAFYEEAVRRLLRDCGDPSRVEVNRINELADELNREAEDVLEYQF